MNALKKSAIAVATAGLSLSALVGLSAAGPAYADTLTPVTSGHADIVDVDCDGDVPGEAGSALNESPIDASTHEFVFTDNNSTVDYNNVTDEWEITVGSPGTEASWVGFAYDEDENCDPETAPHVDVDLAVADFSGDADGSVRFVSTNSDTLEPSDPLDLTAGSHEHGTWYIGADPEGDATVELEFEVSVNGVPLTGSPITTTFTVTDTP